MDELITVLNDVNASRYFSYATFSLLLYDHLITFGDEIHLVWQSKSVNLVKVLFVGNRYLVPLFLAIDIAFLSGLVGGLTASTCHSWLIFVVVVEIISLFSTTYIITLRVRALWTDNRAVNIFLQIIWTVQVIITTGLTINGVVINQSSFTVYPLLDLCFAKITDLWTIWLPVMVFHVVIFVMLIVKALWTPRNEHTRLLAILLVDGFVFFFVVFGAMFLNLIIWAVGDPDLALLPHDSVWAISTLAISRLLLSLQQRYHGQEYFEPELIPDLTTVDRAREAKTTKPALVRVGAGGGTQHRLARLRSMVDENSKKRSPTPTQPPLDQHPLPSSQVLPSSEAVARRTPPSTEAARGSSYAFAPAPARPRPSAGGKLGRARSMLSRAYGAIRGPAPKYPTQPDHVPPRYALQSWRNDLTIGSFGDDDADGKSSFSMRSLGSGAIPYYYDMRLLGDGSRPATMFEMSSGANVGAPFPPSANDAEYVDETSPRRPANWSHRRSRSTPGTVALAANTIDLRNPPPSSFVPIPNALRPDSPPTSYSRSQTPNGPQHRSGPSISMSSIFHTTPPSYPTSARSQSPPPFSLIHGGAGSTHSHSHSQSNPSPPHSIPVPNLDLSNPAILAAMKAAGVPLPATATTLAAAASQAPRPHFSAEFFEVEPLSLSRAGPPESTSPLGDRLYFSAQARVMETQRSQSPPPLSNRNAAAIPRALPSPPVDGLVPLRFPVDEKRDPSIPRAEPIGSHAQAAESRISPPVLVDPHPYRRIDYERVSSPTIDIADALRPADGVKSSSEEDEEGNLLVLPFVPRLRLRGDAPSSTRSSPRRSSFIRALPIPAPAAYLFDENAEDPRKSAAAISRIVSGMAGPSSSTSIPTRSGARGSSKPLPQPPRRI